MRDASMSVIGRANSVFDYVTAMGQLKISEGIGNAVHASRGILTSDKENIPPSDDDIQSVSSILSRNVAYFPTTDTLHVPTANILKDFSNPNNENVERFCNLLRCDRNRLCQLLHLQQALNDGVFITAEETTKLNADVQSICNCYQNFLHQNNMTNSASQQVRFALSCLAQSAPRLAGKTSRFNYLPQKTSSRKEDGNPPKSGSHQACTSRSTSYRFACRDKTLLRPSILCPDTSSRLHATASHFKPAAL